MTESTNLHPQQPSSTQNNKSIFNLPNNLTIARILMIPLFVAIAYWPPAMGIGMPAISDNVIAKVGMSDFSDSLLRHLLLTGVFILAAITDWLDGYFARKLNVVSAFGRFCPGSFCPGIRRNRRSRSARIPACAPCTRSGRAGSASGGRPS